MFCIQIKDTVQSTYVINREKYFYKSEKKESRKVSDEGKRCYIEKEK